VPVLKGVLQVNICGFSDCILSPFPGPLILRSVSGMNQIRAELIAAARAVCGDFPLQDEFTAGGVGAAIRTVGGHAYTGICIDLGSGLGFCAEVAAMAEMLKHRETQIETIVAVSGQCILPPCGRCRETMAQIDSRNMNCRVIVAEDQEVLLRDLLPKHWLNKENTEPHDSLDLSKAAQSASSPSE